MIANSCSISDSIIYWDTTAPGHNCSNVPQGKIACVPDFATRESNSSGCAGLDTVAVEESCAQQFLTCGDVVAGTTQNYFDLVGSSAPDAENRPSSSIMPTPPTRSKSSSTRFGRFATAG